MAGCQESCSIPVFNLYLSEPPVDFDNSAMTPSVPTFGPSHPSLTLSCPVVHINRNSAPLTPWGGNCAMGPISLFESSAHIIFSQDWQSDVSISYTILDYNDNVIASGPMSGDQYQGFHFDIVGTNSTDLVNQENPKIPYFDKATLTITYLLANPSNYSSPDIQSSDIASCIIVKQRYC